MPYSCIHEGKVLDFHYKRIGDITKNFHYAFYIGDIYVGQIFRMGKGDYSVVGNTPNFLSPINGLNSRFIASELLLKMEGYWGRER